MVLITAATRQELAAFTNVFGEHPQIAEFVTGIGPVEAAVRLTSRLSGSVEPISLVINIGVAGAYREDALRPAAGLLDICLARKEILGELGIGFDDRIEPFDNPSLGIRNVFELDPFYLKLAGRALNRANLAFQSGSFITASSVSGTDRRGRIMGKAHEALCENMEGAAVARVCLEFDIPCLEVRCISNLVEDRDRSRWKLKEACERSGVAAAVIVRDLFEGAKRTIS